MLHSMQAVVVYGMLCAQHTELIPGEDAAWLLVTIEVRINSIHERDNTR